jgi:hypothetical protein
MTLSRNQIIPSKKSNKTVNYDLEQNSIDSVLNFKKFLKTFKYFSDFSKVQAYSLRMIS